MAGAPRVGVEGDTIGSKKRLWSRDNDSFGGGGGGTTDRDGGGGDVEHISLNSKRFQGRYLISRRMILQDGTTAPAAAGAAPASAPAAAPPGAPDPLSTPGGSAAAGGAAAMTAIAFAKTIKEKFDMFKNAKTKVVPLLKKSKDLQERIVTEVQAKREECVAKVKDIKASLKVKLEDAKNKSPPPGVDGKEAEMEWRKELVEKIKDDSAKEAALVMELPKELEKKYRKEIKAIAAEIKVIALELPSGEKIIAMIEKGIKVAEEKAAKLKKKKEELEAKKKEKAEAKEAEKAEKERIKAEKAAEKEAAKKGGGSKKKKGDDTTDEEDMKKAAKKAAKKAEKKKEKKAAKKNAVAPQEEEEEEEPQRVGKQQQRDADSEDDDAHGRTGTQEGEAEDEGFIDDAQLEEEERRKEKREMKKKEKFEKTLGGATATNERMPNLSRRDANKR